MKIQCKCISFCSIILLLLAIFSCGKKDEKSIKLDGSRTMGPLLHSLAESYQKNSKTLVEIKEPGSLKGFSLLLEGRCDIASSSVKIPAPQLFEFQKKGVILKEFIIAYDIIIPIVHPSNRIKNLFQGQLADMYTGLIKDWKGVEGNPGPVKVVDRDEFSGTRLLMNERFFETTTVLEGSIKKKMDSDVVKYVAQHPASVGYISKRFIDGSVKALSINSFSGSLENVEKGYYPLYRELYLYVNEKSYTGEVRSFIDYCLSASGQMLIEKNGFIPVSRITKQIK